MRVALHCVATSLGNTLAVHVGCGWPCVEPFVLLTIRNTKGKCLTNSRPLLRGSDAYCDTIVLSEHSPYNYYAEARFRENNALTNSARVNTTAQYT